MKRLGILVAGLLCVTIGGVYAAWTYAENASVSPVDKDKAIQLETYVDSGEAPGVYNLTPMVDTTNPVNNEDLFYFDSSLSVSGDTEDPHRVELVVNCDLVITFTPSEFASDDVKANGYDTTVTFSMQDAFKALQVDGVSLFNKFEPTTVDISGVTTTGELHKWTWDEAKGCFTYTITKANLITHLNYELNDEFKLESSAEHSAFSSAITGMTIKTTVAKTA